MKRIIRTLQYSRKRSAFLWLESQDTLYFRVNRWSEIYKDTKTLYIGMLNAIGY